jgi:LCP family protein required for cell wall assembly
MTIDIDLKDSKLDDKIKIPKSSRKKNITPLSTEEKIKRRKKRVTLFLFSLSFFIILGIGFLVYKGYIFSKGIGFKFDPTSLISAQNKELKKDSSGQYTNMLLVGIDTRESGGLLNTDTIILASYDHTNHDITMLSIPRDFHVEVSKDTAWYVRINSIYASAEGKEKDSGMDALVGSVERLTGQDIQYYAMVDFRAFVEIIDAVGGIDVNVENSFTDYMYPKGLGYMTVTFKAGPQTMDGETALIYSRSRHAQQNNEGTDFARARRQQKVIIALKEKISTNASFSDPKTLMSIVSSIAGNIKVSEFTIKDIEAAFELSKKYDEAEGSVFSFVLDPSSGGGLIVDRKNMESGAYAIGPKLGFGKYDDIQEFISLIRKNPKLYSEDPKIVVYDTGLGFQKAKEQVEELKDEFPYLNITFAGTLFRDKEGIVIYPKEEEEKLESIKMLSEFFNTKLNEKPEYITSNLNGQDVTILLGKSIQLNEE